jgi:cathepsin B
MKLFTVAVITILALTSVGVLKTFEQEETYSARLARIAQEVNAKNVGWTAQAPSRFADLKFENVKAMMGAFYEDLSHIPDVTEVHEFPNAAPDSFDSATQWPKCKSIKEVRDQAACGSCWAFGAVEAMSDRICIASDQTVQTRISAEDLNSCCSSCGMGCNGGYPSAAWDYFVRTGLVTGDLYGNNDWCLPYSIPGCAHHVAPIKPLEPCGSIVPTPACTQKCNSHYTTSYSKDKHYGKNSYSVRGESKMMNELSTNGPFEVAFSVYEDFLSYKTGVYTHTSGRMLGGHAVKVVGYGSESGTDYWLIANSWNETWGDNGFFKISRGNNECGIESQGVAGLPKTN